MAEKQTGVVKVVDLGTGYNHLVPDIPKEINEDRRKKQQSCSHIVLAQCKGQHNREKESKPDLPQKNSRCEQDNETPE